MSLIDRAANWLDSFRATPTMGTVTIPLPGGQSTILNEQQQYLTFTGKGMSYLTPFSADEYWRNTQLDSQTLSKIPPSKLIELLADCSPDVSKALWDFLLFMNPGWKVQAFRPGTKTNDTKCEEALKTFFRSLHGPFALNHTMPLDVALGSLFMGVFMRGAFVAELVLDEAGRMPVDIATPDPVTIKARPKEDPIRQVVWEIGQWQKGQFIVLDRPTVFYIPVHPLPGKPYGRSLAAPAVFSTLFLLGLLHDLRRVVMQQGWPRHDITIDFSKLNPPQTVKSDPAKLKAWQDNVIAEVLQFYAKLEPDHAFVHSEAITLGKPAGTLDSNSLGKLDELIRMVERMSVRGLKTIPLLFGINDSTTETSANRAWEMQVAGIKSLQHLAETMMEKICEIALQVQGMIADVEFRFAELRVSELLRDAQVEAAQIENEYNKYVYGWTTIDEGSNKITGHDAVEREPRALEPAVTTVPANTGGSVDPGQNRWIRLSKAYRRQLTAPRFAHCPECNHSFIDDIRTPGALECPNCGPGVAVLRGYKTIPSSKPVNDEDDENGLAS